MSGSAFLQTSTGIAWAIRWRSAVFRLSTYQADPLEVFVHPSPIRENILRKLIVTF